MHAVSYPDTPFDAPAVGLDELALEPVHALAVRYAHGHAPEDLRSLPSDPVGRMLAIRYADWGRVGEALRALAGSARFPWDGKSFQGHSATAGEGINRVHLLGRHRWFRFETRRAPSVMDGRPCVVLDYDLPENPGFIRKIHDEIREVAPGVMLGPAMWRGPAGPALVLWFGLSAAR